MAPVRPPARLLALLAVLLAATAAAPPPPRADAPAAAAVRSPEDLFGPLYEAVELAHVFPDSKTFPDLSPREAPSAVMAAFRAEAPTGRAALAAFVARHFEGGPAADRPAGLRAHVRALWPVLARAPVAVPPGGSALQLFDAYVVPGGRYQEIYYWDSYFSMLGLKADGQQPLVEAMIDNFTSLIERYGHIPNGTRSYYLGRSQPPFFFQMIDLSERRDPATAARRLAALRAEHAYWMAGASCVAAAADGACRHVVRMPDGSLLNRFWDARDTPRDESYAEDRATAARAASRPAPAVWRDLRAAGESGWDFSSRWLRDGRTLASIHTTDIVPPDLNALLWGMERRIAAGCAAAGDAPCAREFEQRADARQRAVDRYLWQPREGRYADWDRSTGAATPSVSAATLVPLYVGMAGGDQAAAVAATTGQRLVAPGGLRTTLARTGQQWDTPNGWAPLQWMAVVGLGRYGRDDLARTIGTRWLATVDGFYRRTGRLIEKYDVETGSAGGGGEYLVQDGFGWTNGTVSAIMDRYGLRDGQPVPR